MFDFMFSRNVKCIYMSMCIYVDKKKLFIKNISYLLKKLYKYKYIIIIII